MCSVVGCDSWRRSVQSFKLPEDPERRLEWVQFILKVNEQRLKESSWTEISICDEHFTADCFENLTGTVQLKPSAVPSLCVKPEPDEPEPDQEPEETTEYTVQCDQIKTDSPSSLSGESGPTSAAAQQSPEPNDASDALMYDYGQTLQKVANIDIIRKKASLLQMKRKYVVNEKRLLQLFSPKCPSCGSKVKTEKVTYGVLVFLNQQCLQCEYRNQWKSQADARVPTAEDQHLTEEVEVEVTPEIQQPVSADDSVAEGFEIVADIDGENSDPTDETEESGDDGDTDSDEDWDPEEELLLSNELHAESEEEMEEEEVEEEDSDCPPLSSKHTELCTDCGVFFNTQKPHTCEHIIKPYSCNICGKRCVNELALNSHSRIHDENYEIPCKYCNVTFKTKLDKITHEQIHLTQEKPYKCPDCSKTFATNKQRRIHRRDHGGPQQLNCHICGLGFTHTNSLQRHLPVHTGEKPFECSVCQRGFKQAGHLKSHMRLHTGEKPYKCQHCDESFNHNVSLKSHVQRYHSSNSGREQKKRKIKKTVSDTSDAQGDGNKTSIDLVLDDVEEDFDIEEEVQNVRKHKTKHKKRSTGRPIGRPKRNAAGDLVPSGEVQQERSNTKAAKVKRRKIKKTRCSDEESEDEPTGSDMSFDPAEEEEENSENVTPRATRLRKRTKHSAGDSDFDPEEKKQRKKNKAAKTVVKAKKV